MINIFFKCCQMIRATVIKGFGRGSKELGIRTANLDETTSFEMARDGTGVFMGFCKLNDVVYPMVMSVGWNPFYKNKVPSAEVHILHEFENDFYGSEIQVIKASFIRNELNFESLDSLIEQIKLDIQFAEQNLENYSYLKSTFQ